MEIRPLRQTDDRTDFRSGDEDLDRFFARYSGQNQFRHHIGTTYVAVEGPRVLGYATVAPGQVEGEGLPAGQRRRLPAYPLPVLRLARLAVDQGAQGESVGRALLAHVLRLALRMAVDYGCVGVVVDAKPGAVGFYERFGFTTIEVVAGARESRPQPTALFLPLDLVALALVPPPR
jgi:GNAT superfamily N-acetyltransferase